MCARAGPDVLVTIDSPGFTLRLLPALPAPACRACTTWRRRSGPGAKAGCEHFPGLWERLLCLLPFEPAFFARYGLPATFVGHPVLQSGADRGDAARFRAAHGLAEDETVLVLMPGSRRTEVARLLPVFGATLSLLRGRIPGLVPVVPVASAVAETVRLAAEAWPVQPVIVTELDDKHDAYAAASAALTKSGTSTLELALAGVPMAVTYRVNPLTAVIARRLIRVEHVAMVNLLAGREAVPELLQQECRPARLAETVGIPARRPRGGAGSDAPPSRRWLPSSPPLPARRPRPRRGRCWRCSKRRARRRRIDQRPVPAGSLRPIRHASATAASGASSVSDSPLSSNAAKRS